MKLDTRGTTREITRWKSKKSLGADSAYVEKLLADYEAHKAFVWRLKNWVRVARTKPWKSSKVGSIEGRWKSPQIWHREQPKIPVDELQAWETEQAWQNLPMPYRICLQLRLHHRVPERKVCWRIGIHHSKFHETMRKARKALREALNPA